MKTTIYLIRHGQSEGNLQDLFIGHTDIALTELGHRQAEMTAAYLETIPADCIYSSDLQRAYDTACATARRKGLPVIKSAQLREIYGGLWEKQRSNQLGVRFPEDYKDWCEDFGNCRCTEGESVLELQQRIVGELRRIAEENPGKTVFVFCHATPIRVFCGCCQGVSSADMRAIPWATNASVTHVEYENGEFRLLAYSIDHFLGDQVTALSAHI